MKELFIRVGSNFIFLAFILLPCCIAQLNSGDSRILFQVQQKLEYPQVLQGWSNWTNFCFLPSNPNLVVVCSGNHITELTIVGNKTNPKLPASFSMDSFFTDLTKVSTLKKLTLVSLGLWGPLPPKVDRFWSLEVMNFSSNFINGEIPSSISKIKNLTTLDLSNNMLNGSVPDLKGLQHLEIIDLGSNHLGPKYPSLSYNLVSVTLKNNLIRTQIPSDFFKFIHLERLDISSNKIVGPIPSVLFSLSSIQYLNLANNQFSGAMPTNLSCTSKLGFVDVSNNLLIGNLPSCIATNSANRTVISTWNCLTNSTSKYQHPKKFCQKEAIAVMPTKKSGESKKNETTVKLGLVLGIIGGIVGIAGLIGLLFLGIYRKRAAKRAKEYRSDSFAVVKNADRAPSSIAKEVDLTQLGPTVPQIRRPQTMRTAALGLPPYTIFTLEEIEEATNNFDSMNLVGEGSQAQLYKGWLRDGTTVLIKCLKLKQKHSAQTLQQHMEVISKLRHRHLVSVLGHCIVSYVDHPNSGSTVFVVLENVSNGSLRDHLTDWKKKDFLKWPHRMGITMGIARGIQFLHTGTQHGIFGNDLKIETVLLDDNLTAKISSYNISLPSKTGSESPLNSHDASQVFNRQTNPEKDDIYQFGVIILQLISGKPVNSEDEITELKNQLEIGLAESAAKLKEVADPSLRGTFAYESLTTAVQIAINCLNEDVSARPSIEDVLWNMQYSVQVQEGWNSSGNLSTML
ncbi:probable LRR receptor-like serine/threonine-protein kinase At1g14390 isoform X2 [Rutidosis leptorrhynchoides]|uniref:probable LRR receptor-like serine/threonine-protein kinase At1g14390 isoform X2 n=1 Tax=Rutidosis leptorrhynchoides TaxID=125765 RepID=UPI003A98F08B